ncbi:hypothetical protein [Eubacterium sp. 1001713B170207_170306_E7]|uniref:hypothetical protein n=1 Tax=Eubacterium sp. 1001713B170207_170306_E7 TaxID=2787097 RepID=UPI001899C67F|nr:hypothetical protein [Eubacterium sp. 1001713B170207_170306_E7]
MKKKITAALLCLGLLLLSAAPVSAGTPDPAPSPAPTPASNTSVLAHFVLPEYKIRIPDKLDFGSPSIADENVMVDLNVEVTGMTPYNNDASKQAYVNEHYQVRFKINGESGDPNFKLTKVLSGATTDESVEYYVFKKITGSGDEQVYPNSTFAELKNGGQQAGYLKLGKPPTAGLYQGVVQFEIGLEYVD